jgi:hypothetical protein
MQTPGRRRGLTWLATVTGLLAGCSLDVGRPEAPEFDGDLLAEVTRFLRDVREAPSTGDLTRFGLPAEVSVLQLACFPVVSGDTTRNASRVPADQLHSWPVGRCARADVQVRSFSGNVRVQDLGGRFAARVTHGVSGVLGSGLSDVLVDFSGTVEVRALDDTTGEARVQRTIAARVTQGASAGDRVNVQDFSYRWVDRLGVPRPAAGPFVPSLAIAGTLIRTVSGTPRDSVRIGITTVVPLEGDNRCPVGYRVGEVELQVTGTRTGTTRIRMTC